MCCRWAGTRERVTLDKQTKESQFVGDNTGVRITGAAGLVLLTVSDYTLEMGKLSDFAGQTAYPLLADLRAQLEKVAARYSTDGAFDYDAALAAHLKVYRPQFDAVTLTLSDENLQPNEALLKAQKGKKEINAGAGPAYLLCRAVRSPVLRRVFYRTALRYVDRGVEHRLGQQVHHGRQCEPANGGAE